MIQKVGKLLDIHLDPRRIFLDDLAQPARHPLAHLPQVIDIHLPHVGVEHPLLVSDRSDHAARMESVHIVHHLGINVEEDEEALKRIVAQLARPRLKRLHDPVILGEETLEQLAREIVLVAEVIEEAAFGDPGCFDQLLDRRRGKALLDDRLIGEVHDPLARLLALGAGAAFQLYRRSSFLDQLVDHRRFAPWVEPAKLH
jgi:hypothetical protein